MPIADFIPARTHVSDNVVRLRGDGSYLATWRVDGIPFETADVGEIFARKNGLHNLMRGLSGGQFSLVSHKIRRRVSARLSTDYENANCRGFAERYYEKLTGGKQMATELYLSLIYKPERESVKSIFKRVKLADVEEVRERQRAELDTLEDAAKQVEQSLHRYDAARLGCYSKGEIKYSEILALLGYLVNGVWEEFPLARCDIAEYLPVSRLHFGDTNGMVEIWHPRQRKFAGLLDFKDYPRWSEPGMLNAVLYGDYEYIETQSFALMHKRDGMKELNRIAGQLRATEDVAEDEIKAIEDSIRDLQGGQIEWGSYHYSLAVFGESLEAVASNIAHARQSLEDGPGFKMAMIDAIPDAAWFAQQPGNWDLRPREASISSRNFVNLCPLHNFDPGKRTGNPWGEALALFATPSGQPYFMNFHTSPEDLDSTDEKHPGNTFICGATGVGKTALQMALVAFAHKYQGLRAVCFDKDRGMEIGIRWMGGKYFALKRGVPTGFNPFQRDPTESNIQFAERCVGLLVRPQMNNPPPLSAREEEYISRAVRTVMNEKFSRHNRCLSAIAQNLPATGDNSLKDRLRKWLRGQPLGWVFDNPEDLTDFSGATLFGYDYTEFLDDAEVRTPIMAYLLELTQSMIDGRPFIYIMEEFWKPLMDNYFRDFAKNKQKTIRKENGLGVFVTQSPSDVLTSEIGKTMVEQSVTQIYLPNPRADRDDYVNGFKVTEAEFQIIKEFDEMSRMMLIKQGHRSAIVQFNLAGMSDILNIFSGSIDNVAMLDSIREEVGDDPAVWGPVLHQRIAERRANQRRSA